MYAISKPLLSFNSFNAIIASPAVLVSIILNVCATEPWISNLFMGLVTPIPTFPALEILKTLEVAEFITLSILLALLGDVWLNRKDVDDPAFVNSNISVVNTSVFNLVVAPWTIKLELTTKLPFIPTSALYVDKFIDMVPSPPKSILLPFLTAPRTLEDAIGNLKLLIVPSDI